VEILVDESVVLYVWCGNGVPTRSITRGGEVLPTKFYGFLGEIYLRIVLNYWASFKNFGPISENSSLPLMSQS